MGPSPSIVLVPISSLYRPHSSGSFKITVTVPPTTSVSTRSQGPMGSRMSSSRQPMGACPSPSIPSVPSLFCTHRPSESWSTSITVHFTHELLLQIESGASRRVVSDWISILVLWTGSVCGEYVRLFPPLPSLRHFFFQLIFESIPHMYVRTATETISLLMGDIASPLSLRVCLPLGGRRMLCGARRISMIECNA